MSPRRAIPSRKNRGRWPPWLVVTAIAVVVVGAFTVGADFWAKVQSPPVGPSPSGLAVNGRTKGDPKAPIAFIEYSDFQ